MPEETLIVVVGGLGNSDSAWRRLEVRLRENGIIGEWYCHQTSGLRTVFRGSTVRNITEELITKIDSRAQGRKRIILVGHSAGGMIVRDAYLLAAGAYPDHPNKLPWWDKVESILLFASINRGFRPYARTSWALGLAIMKLVSLQWLLLKPPLGFPLGWLMELERGSFFVTDLRLAWMRYFHERDDEYRPFVVQFIGDIDGVVAHEDVRDTEAFVNSYTVTINGADHFNLFDPDAPPAGNGFPEILKVFQNPEPSDSKLAEALTDTGPERVIFILHGIRDGNSGWVTDIAEAIEKKCKEMGLSVSVDRSTYGWFSAIKFALPWVRRKNLPWFLDRYSYHVARNPNVRFHFIGHSNGTYILGTSLLKVSSLIFDRIYLAGSVLPREYPWKRIFAKNQVSTVANQCSSDDWPVGWLCRGLHWIGFRDVGTGGFDGFKDLKAWEQTQWFKGNHGKPLQRPNQPNIVDYILSTKIESPLMPTPEDLCSNPSLWFKTKMYLFSPILAMVILTLGAMAWYGWTHGYHNFVILFAALLYFIMDAA